MNRISIKLLNNILKYNESSLHLLSLLHGKTFIIKLNNMPVIEALIMEFGYLNGEFNNIDNIFDVSINIPLENISYLWNPDKLLAIKKIHFEGNSEFGYKVLNILTNLKYDKSILIDEAPLIFKYPITFILNLLSNLQAYLIRLTKSALTSTSEYLKFEAAINPTSFEMAKYLDGVDDVKERTDQLQSRINRLFKLSHESAQDDQLEVSKDISASPKHF